MTSAAASARSAYASPDHATITPRDAEYRAFARVTSRMVEAAAETPKLIGAMHDNLRLWLTLAVDLADDGNALPEQLRAQLLYLADFTRMHTMACLAEEGEIDAQPLIDVNLAIMKGLRGEPPAEPATEPS